MVPTRYAENQMYFSGTSILRQGPLKQASPTPALVQFSRLQLTRRFCHLPHIRSCPLNDLFHGRKW